MLKSPGIEFFESSVNPQNESSTINTNGVATLAYSDRGPVNKLIKITSVNEFNRTFGKPASWSDSSELPYAHTLALKVLGTGQPVYFYRLESESAAPATVSVIQYNVTEMIQALEFSAESDDDVAKLSTSGNELTITINDVEKNIGFQDGMLAWPTLISKLSLAYPKYKFETSLSDDSKGVLIKSVNKSSVGQVSITSTGATVNSTGTFNGNTLSNQATFTPNDSAYSFKISAKYSGSGLGKAKIVKNTVGGEYFITLYDADGTKLEEFTNLTANNFIEKINDKSSFIQITELSSEADPEWKDGIWKLGEGWDVNNSGYYYAHTNDSHGSNGSQPSVSKEVGDYMSALGSADFKNSDVNIFSILATPNCQEQSVLEAAVSLCVQRGDCEFLVDIPFEYCTDKAGITDAVIFANMFNSSYAAPYYGWFKNTDIYSGNKEKFPASVFVAQKMMECDRDYGEFLAPAGVVRGGISALDYFYSPDQEDRDMMLDGVNALNPIIYSSSRGIMIFAQKTADKTNSPLNRVGIRRMTNAIKRQLRQSLQNLLFEPNNEYSRNTARRLCENVLETLKNSNFIETYEIDTVSGTGADRNTLNIYLSFAPYGLIEKIYVYVNISEAGIEINEIVK